MKDAIYVGRSYHFWLNEQDDIYNLLYGENMSNPEQSRDLASEDKTTNCPCPEDISRQSEKE
ncbi:hypothetical protein [Brevibacillus centrosporus]|uniref:hypothetical protein n=1 Tax=Brevibacillus centrosporus TaxID=54910 RepID=UPI003B023BE2